MVAAIQPGAKLGPIGHVISFLDDWPPWLFHGTHAITPSNGHILPPLALLANSYFTNPQAFIFDFGPGGSFCVTGALRSEEGLALSKLGLTYGGLKDKIDEIHLRVLKINC
ncbi:hypothetical protein O181_047149 [Austropuccinia psidii MF-1]|uniref:Uncharacterized protein n=1 Tax=Austropuccinia psidii MF-1 TaxID=1389203 RepID=A0A9Q3DQG6_9BASI|nr:hypothetical protein [Austropuccinia psidii MF-1]